MEEGNRIHFHCEEVDFSLSNPEVETKWILDVLHRESKECGEINIIFCSDDYLLQINQKFLDHDYYTDIITFNYNEGDVISGDIYISIDRVEENANSRRLTLKTELNRVVIHGVLHLIGYDDKDLESQARMRAQEDFCLTLHPLRNEEGST